MSLITASAFLTTAASSSPTMIGIAAPVDSQFSASELRIRVTGLPGDGTVYLADSVTPVLPGELLSMTELTGLTFAGGADAAGQSAQFVYLVSDPSGTSATGTASLSVVANTNGPQTTEASLTLAANSGASAINIAAPTDPQYSAGNLTITVLGVPSDGRVVLADGVTPVIAGQVLTVSQLGGLEFAPTAGVVAESSLFSYRVNDPSGAGSLGSAILSVAPAGNILTVGAGKQFSTIAAAIAASHDGDTIQVQAGTYVNDFAAINTNITLEGVGGMVNLVCTEQIPNGKAIFITNGDITINNFSFSGAQVADANGAGIRYESGNLVLNNDAFFHNEDGLLSAADPSGSITINNSEFADNGIGDGFTHNLYVGEVGTLTIDNSYFHDANVGHEIKSRALNTTIQNSRIYDGPAGTASYSIDLPNGGNAVIQNNVIEQGPLSENAVIITIGEEGGIYANTSLTVSGNTILNDLSSSSSLAVRNETSATSQVTGNQFFGLTSSQIASGPNVQSNNTILASEPTLDTTHPWSPEIASVIPFSAGPVLGGSTSANVGEGSLIVLGATDAVSDPNDTLGAVTISGLPGDLTNFSGGAYSPGTGTWTGDAASFNALSFNVGEDSVYALTISAETTGAEAGTTSEGYTLTVNPVPEGPKLSGATSTTVSEGAVVILGATDAVSDPNDMLGAVTISGLPGDLTNFSGGAYSPGTGTWTGDAASFNALSFTTGEDGVYALTISATTTGTEAGTTNENYTLTINEAPPVANAGSVTTAANQTVSGVVSVTDPDNDAAFMLNTNPSHGTLTAFDSATGAFTYMPNAGYFGPDSFTFHGTDGYLASNTATESITINAGVAPTGWNFSYDATHLGTLESGSKGTDLLKNTQLGIFTELGGGAGDSYTFTLGGSGASSFAMTSTGDVGTLSTGNADVAGGTNGTLYSLTVQVNDATNGTHTVAQPFDVWVGQKSGRGNSTVNLATIEGAASGPTIAYPLHGIDTISAAGLSAPVWFASGTGPDKMTGGSAGNTYLYAAVRDSGQGALADTITNFKAASDKFDFSDITGLTNVQGLLTSTNTQVGAHSIAWILSGSNTLVYGNDTGRSVAQSKAHMEVVLNGSSIGLTASDFIHH